MLQAQWNRQDEGFIVHLAKDAFHLHASKYQEADGTINKDLSDYAVTKLNDCLDLLQLDRLEQCVQLKRANSSVLPGDATASAALPRAANWATAAERNTSLGTLLAGLGFHVESKACGLSKLVDPPIAPYSSKDSAKSYRLLYARLKDLVEAYDYMKLLSAQLAQSSPAWHAFLLGPNAGGCRQRWSHCAWYGAV
jgi:hypothetical protein